MEVDELCLLWHQQEGNCMSSRTQYGTSFCDRFCFQQVPTLQIRIKCYSWNVPINVNGQMFHIMGRVWDLTLIWIRNFIHRFCNFRWNLRMEGDAMLWLCHTSVYIKVPNKLYVIIFVLPSSLQTECCTCRCPFQTSSSNGAMTYWSVSVYKFKQLTVELFYDGLAIQKWNHTLWRSYL